MYITLESVKTFVRFDHINFDLGYLNLKYDIHPLIILSNNLCKHNNVIFKDKCC